MTALPVTVDLMELIILLLIIALAWALMMRGGAWAKAARRAAAQEESGDAPAHEPEPSTVGSLGFDVVLRYTDRDGQQTERRVTVREAWGSFGPRGGFEFHNLLRGHCHMRDATRSFHILGMDSLTDPTSGETVRGPRRIERWLSRKIGAEVRAGRGRRWDHG